MPAGEPRAERFGKVPPRPPFLAFRASTIAHNVFSANARLIAYAAPGSRWRSAFVAQLYAGVLFAVRVVPVSLNPRVILSVDRLAETALLRRPFTIFAVIHAVRIACVYRGIARAGGYDRQLGGKWSCAAADATLLFRFAPTWRLTPFGLQTYKRRLFRSC